MSDASEVNRASKGNAGAADPAEVLPPRSAFPRPMSAARDSQVLTRFHNLTHTSQRAHLLRLQPGSCRTLIRRV